MRTLLVFRVAVRRLDESEAPAGVAGALWWRWVPSRNICSKLTPKQLVMVGLKVGVACARVGCKAGIVCMNSCMFRCKC